MNYTIFDTLLDAVIVVDGQGHIVYSNQIAVDLIGSSFKRVVGKNFSDLYKFETPFYSELLNVTAATPYKEISLHTKSGHPKLVQGTIQPEEALNANNERWIIFLRDATVEANLQRKYTSEQKEKAIFRLAAEQDGLTGIYNKKAFWEKFKFKIIEAEAKKYPISLIFFDLDNFKKLNDTYGHPAGDYVLVEVTRIIEGNVLRSNDIFGRYGGEEFVIVLYNCNIKNAVNVAERIRKTVEAYEFNFQGHRLNVTISVGVGEKTNSSETAEAFLQRVDGASYVSKKSGKNRVSQVKEEA